MSSQSTSESTSPYQIFLEELNEQYEVEECEELTDQVVIKCTLPYNSPNNMATECFLAKLTIDQNDLSYLEILEVPEFLKRNKEELQMPMSNKKLNKDTWTLIDVVDSFYYHIEQILHPAKPNQILCRDFAFPVYDQRHYNRYPPTEHKWHLATLTQAFRSPDESLHKGQEVLVREVCGEDRERDLSVIRTKEDHLPNKIVHVPSFLVEKKSK